MTESLVERVRRLAEKATEGPWYRRVYKAEKEDEAQIDAGECEMVLYGANQVVNATFIAVARTDAPRLCDLVEELATALGECLQEHGGFTIAGECERRARAALEKVKAP